MLLLWIEKLSEYRFPPILYQLKTLYCSCIPVIPWNFLSVKMQPIHNVEPSFFIKYCKIIPSTREACFNTFNQLNINKYIYWFWKPVGHRYSNSTQELIANEVFWLFLPIIWRSHVHNIIIKSAYYTIHIFSFNKYTNIVLMWLPNAFS